MLSQKIRFTRLGKYCRASKISLLFKTFLTIQTDQYKKLASYYKTDKISLVFQKQIKDINKRSCSTVYPISTKLSCWKMLIRQQRWNPGLQQRKFSKICGRKLEQGEKVCWHNSLSFKEILSKCENKFVNAWSRIIITLSLSSNRNLYSRLNLTKIFEKN